MFVQVTGYLRLPTRWNMMQVQHTPTRAGRRPRGPPTAHPYGMSLYRGRTYPRNAQVTGVSGAVQRSTALGQHTPRDALVPVRKPRSRSPARVRRPRFTSSRPSSALSRGRSTGMAAPAIQAASMDQKFRVQRPHWIGCTHLPSGLRWWQLYGTPTELGSGAGRVEPPPPETGLTSCRCLSNWDCR